MENLAPRQQLSGSSQGLMRFGINRQRRIILAQDVERVAEGYLAPALTNLVIAQEGQKWNGRSERAIRARLENVKLQIASGQA